MLFPAFSALACIAYITSVAAGPTTGGPKFLARRNGWCDVSKHNNHQAPKDTCEQMLSYISQNMAYQPIPISPRNLCLDLSPPESIGYGQCCISWSKEVYSGTMNDLANAGWNIVTGCATDNVRSDGTIGISGLDENWQVGDEQTNVCISDRPDNCH
ncbi:hypothetical protein BGZ63DRAFT_421399 [Mariannaea sp. PMI_226]|nr:hypothetical protein BGZ63DRAFT_421399 [Mariannaea sp. PMI_226]